MKSQSQLSLYSMPDLISFLIFLPKISFVYSMAWLTTPSNDDIEKHLKLLSSRFNSSSASDSHRVEIRRYNHSRIEAENIDPIITGFEDVSFQAFPDGTTPIHIHAKQNGLIEVNNNPNIPFMISVSTTATNGANIILVNIRYDPELNALRVNGHEYVLFKDCSVNMAVEQRPVLEMGNIFNIHLDIRCLSGIAFDDSRVDIRINDGEFATLFLGRDGLSFMGYGGSDTVQALNPSIGESIANNLRENFPDQ